MSARGSGALTIVVREKFPGDGAALVALARALPEGVGEKSLARISSDLADHTGLVAESKDVPVGFVTWASGETPGSAEVTWLAVAATARRRGVGARLVRSMIERLRARGVRAVEASVAPVSVVRPEEDGMRRVLLACGFREVRVDLDRPGSAPNRLVLRLAL